MAGQEGERDQGQDVVDGVVVLGDAQGPADHRRRCRGVGVGQLADGVGGDARLALGVLKGVRLDLVAVGLEIEGCSEISPLSGCLAGTPFYEVEH